MRRLADECLYFSCIPPAGGSPAVAAEIPDRASGMPDDREVASTQVRWIMSV